MTLDPILSVGYFSDADAYVDGNPDFPDERAGSNDSDADDFITGSGWDNYYRLRFKYLLPIGSGRDQVLPAYQLSEGLLTDGASGATAWNPLDSGRTFLELRPFYRTQNIENDDIDEEQSTNGLELSVFWDNRDYPQNPSRGNALTLEVTRDWGWADSSTSWTNVSAEYDHNFSLKSPTSTLSASTTSARSRAFARACWPWISGQPTRQRGMCGPTAQLHTSRRPSAAPTWAVSFG